MCACLTAVLSESSYWSTAALTNEKLIIHKCNLSVLLHFAGCDYVTTTIVIMCFPICADASGLRCCRGLDVCMLTSIYRRCLEEARGAMSGASRVDPRVILNACLHMWLWNRAAWMTSEPPLDWWGRCSVNSWLYLNMILLLRATDVSDFFFGVLIISRLLFSSTTATSYCYPSWEFVPSSCLKRQLRDS